ncbi:C2 domain-containing protein 3-like [Centruroides vittatus]|uniref:C2 domain-containing protein 3-like n=1 Tax=Centruroides vittatus TaxID=120091 RepID=UPI00350F4DFB
MADVIVHTSLPPDVEGPITGYLYLHIPFIIWEKNFKNHINEVIYIKVLWWGEKSNGSIFFPSNIQRSEAYIMPRTVARYEIRSAPLQFSSYLKDMETINLQVLSSATVIGIAVVNVSTLKQDASIVGKFSVISSSQVKIAELQVKITISPVKEHLTSTLGRNQNIKQSEDNGKSSLNHYHRIMKHTADDLSESSDLVTLLLERAKSLREAMIVSLLQSKSLEKFLQNENTKHINENSREDLIENILGGSRKEKVINQDQNIVDVSDSSSSSNSQLADLNDSLDSLPDDSVINELFYKDKSVQELSPTMHKFHKNYQYKIKPISKSSESRSKVELPENDLHYNSNTHLSSEMKSLPENVKSIKVKIKNIKFKFSQKSSHNSVATLLEQNKLR